MSDLLSLPIDLIKTILGEASPAAQEIPYFAPFYNFTVLVWMAAVAAIFVAPFWKRFRGFAVSLTWLAIFLTLIQRGSSTSRGEIDALSALFGIGFSIGILVVFIILTLWIFAKLLSVKKVIPIPR